jgi:hypothetical protein
MNKIGASNIMIIVLIIVTVLGCWMLFGNSDLEKTDIIEVQDVKDPYPEGNL